MNNRLYTHIKSQLFPFIGLSILTGLLSAIWITVFKIAVEIVLNVSTMIYTFLRQNPIWLPVLILGAAVIGLLSSFILSKSQSCRGGGIPSSIVAIRGIVSFKWISTIFVLPFSALLTFLCGIPLGTEGPCVQMGTAIGDGVSKCINSKKLAAWRRYIMTGGAASGFSVATGCPISAIIFSTEELHKNFSPLALGVASVTVMASQFTAKVLSLLGLGSITLFHMTTIEALDVKLYFTPLVVGIVCGIGAIGFTRFYHFFDRTMKKAFNKLPMQVVFPIIFAGISIVGYFFADALGTGHHFAEKLLEEQSIWYLLIIVFLLRMAFMMIANTSGVTGGVFLPTVAFGAIIGSLCASIMISLGWIESDCYTLIVVLGIAAFWGSTSRVPITACVFAIEALGGVNNILPIIIATTIALLIVEYSGLEDFTDALILSKIKSISKGKRATVVETSLTVQSDSFVVGKEIRDVLWPNECVVISFDRSKENKDKVGIAEGDVIVVHYKTYDAKAIFDELTVLVGEQENNI